MNNQKPTSVGFWHLKIKQLRGFKMDTKYQQFNKYVSELQELFQGNTQIFHSHVDSILVNSMGETLAAFENGVPADEYFQTFLE